jgi:hypothetical protein
MGEVLAERAEAIGEIVCREPLKPLANAVGDVKSPAGIFGGYADEPTPREASATASSRRSAPVSA